MSPQKEASVVTATQKRRYPKIFCPTVLFRRVRPRRQIPTRTFGVGVSSRMHALEERSFDLACLQLENSRRQDLVSQILWQHNPVRQTPQRSNIHIYIYIAVVLHFSVATQKANSIANQETQRVPDRTGTNTPVSTTTTSATTTTT